MSDDFDFNPKPKEDDKGVGKIRLGEDGKPSGTQKTEEKAKTSSKKKWLIGGGIGVGVLALTLTLSGVFNSASNNQTAPVTPPPVVRVEQPPQQAPVQTQLTAAQLLQQSIAAKQGVIYRDPARAFYETTRTGARTGETGEVYLNLNGQTVRAGQDFAVHGELFAKGGFSLLVAAGPYAGSRIEFTPVGPRGGSSITYTRVGQEAIGQDGRTTVFQVLPVNQQTTQTVSMKSPATAGNGVTVPAGAWEFEKQAQEQGEFFPLFTIRGNVDDGVFSVKIYNGDTYNVNFANGQYSVNSVFAYHPNYESETDAGAAPISRRTIPTVNGQLNVAPAVRPQPAAAQRVLTPGG